MYIDFVEENTSHDCIVVSPEGEAEILTLRESEACRLEGLGSTVMTFGEVGIRQTEAEAIVAYQNGKSKVKPVFFDSLFIQ